MTKSNRATSAVRAVANSQGKSATPQERKATIIRALETHSKADRATAAYDTLMSTEPGFVRNINLDNEQAIAKMMMGKLRQHKIAWTKDFANRSSTPQKEANKEAAAELDPSDWDVAVTEHPGDDCSISLSTPQALPTWLKRGTLASQQAVVVLGEYECIGAEQLMLPLLWTAPGEEKPTKVFRLCTLVQLGSDSTVVCKTKVSKIDMQTIEAKCSFVQMKIFSAHSNEHFSKLFEIQFANKDILRAPKAAVQSKVTTRRSHDKQDALGKLNASLAEQFGSLLRTLVHDIELQSPIQKLVRHENDKGQRTLCCTFAVDKHTIDTILYPHSGKQGITFQHAYGTNGDSHKVDSDRFELMWASDTNLKLPDIMEILAKYNTHMGCICDMRRGNVGVRIPIGSAEADEIRRLVTGSTLNHAANKFRISNIPPAIGTKMQIRSILANAEFTWLECEVQHVQYDAKRRKCFAIVKALNDPPSFNIDVGDEVMQIEQLGAKAKQPSLEKVMLKTPIYKAEARLEAKDISVEDLSDMGDEDMFGDLASVKQRAPKANAKPFVTYQAPQGSQSSSSAAQQWATAIKPLQTPGTTAVRTTPAQPPTQGPVQQPRATFAANSGNDPRFAAMQAQIDELKGGVNTVNDKVEHLNVQFGQSQTQQTHMAFSLGNMENLLQGIAEKLQLTGTQPAQLQPPQQLPPQQLPPPQLPAQAPLFIDLEQTDAQRKEQRTHFASPTGANAAAASAGAMVEEH